MNQFKQSDGFFFATVFTQHNHIRLLYESLRSITNGELIFHFGINRGEHIGVTIVDDADYLNSIASIFHHRMTLLLKKLPLSKSPVLNLEQKLFMDFTQNTFRYHLHNFPLNISGITDPKRILLTTRITDIIRNILAEDGIDTESLFSCSFYLHTLLFKSYSKHHSRDNLIAEGVFEALPEVYKSIIPEGQQVVFQEITTDIYNTEFLHEPENEWMVLWSQDCEATFLESTQKQSDVFSAISNLITEQLGSTEFARKSILSLVLENFWNTRVL